MHAAPAFPQLETTRLHMREIVESDAENLFAIHGDPELMRWFGTEPLKDISASHDLVKIFAGWRTQANPGTRWGIEAKNQQGLIGTCGLFRWDRNYRKCVIGYELASHVHGNGYMREALVAAIEWGFENMSLNRIEAQIHPLNSASIKLIASLRFVEEGHFREAAYWSGQHHDMLQYALLKREWRSSSDGGQQSNQNLESAAQTGEMNEK